MLGRRMVRVADRPCFANVPRGSLMKTYAAVIERDADTGLYVGWVPGFPGAHSQGETLDELHGNLREVIELLLDDGDVPLESEFVGVRQVRVG